MPISNSCVSINMKDKGGRGIGENVLDKTIWKDSRGGTGTPQGYQTFSFYFYVTFLFCCFGLIPSIPRIDQRVISHNIVI